MAHDRLLASIEFLPHATFVTNNQKRVVAWNRAIEDNPLRPQPFLRAWLVYPIMALGRMFFCNQPTVRSRGQKCLEERG